VRKGVAATIAGALAASLLVLALFGCGGSDDGSDSLTKAEFKKQATAICKKGNKEREEATTEAIAKFQKRTPESEREVVEAILRPYEQMTASLSELSPPEGEEQKVEGIVKAMEEAAARGKADPSAALEGDTPFRKANKLAKSYGLTECQLT
jgi:hypothetical protein